MTREELYELVWSTAVSGLSERLGVSGSYLKRVCEAMLVPRPGPGYWTLREMGRALPRPPLPSPRPGTIRSWSPGTPLERARHGVVPLSVTREEMYGLLSSTPVSGLTERLGVSESYIARICDAMDVPLPPRKYWSFEGEYKPSLPPLPPPRPGTVQSWSKGTPFERLPRCVPSLSDDGPAAAAAGGGSRRTFHPLVAVAEAQLRAASTDRHGYLRPRMKLMADISTSAEALGKCLMFADALYTALGKRGHHVVVSPGFEKLIRIEIATGEDAGGIQPAWSPLRPTVVYVNGVPLGIALFETNKTVQMRYVGDGRFIPETAAHKERVVGHTWLVRKPMPTGRMRLTGYSPFHDFPVSIHWLEERKGPLDGRLDAIISALEAVSMDLSLRLQAAGRYVRGR